MNKIKATFRSIALLCTAGIALFAANAHADIVIPTGGTMALNGAIVDLACSDVSVAGSLSLDSGQLINVRNLSIGAGGTINAGTGSITLSGNWTNNGAFVPSTGKVRFVDAASCSPSSVITGNTSFYDLSIVSTSGKLYQFGAGNTQTVVQSLTITGTTSNPTRLSSTSTGQTAFIHLIGAQNLSSLAVTDMGATGVWLAPYQSNFAPGGVVSRWFGQGEVIPTLDRTAQLLLLLLILGTAAFATRTGLLRNPNRKDAGHEA